MSFDLHQGYFIWLYERVGGNDSINLVKTHWNLLKILYHKRFEWRIDRDENRAEAGRKLRQDFIRSTNFEPTDEWLSDDCSIFELLVALAHDLAFDDLEGNNVEYWFWIMIRNLGLYEFNDVVPIPENYINDILDIFISRDYSPSGEGGLFPLPNAREDQRNVELRYQAEAYLLAR